MSNFIVNSFQIPNAVIDELLNVLSGAELKCYLYVLRKTKGWNKEEDAISVTQFMKVTGLSNRKVIDACDHLVELGLLEQKTGSNKVKVFSVKDFKISGSEESSLVKKVHSGSEESSLVKKVHSGSEESSLSVVKKVHIQNNNINNTTKNNTPLTPQGEDSPIGKSQKRLAEKIDFQAIADEWNQANENSGGKLPFVEKINNERKREIKKFLGELSKPTLECVGNYFEAFFAALTPHHLGNNDRGWRANFDFAIKPKQVLRVREGAL